MKGFALAFAALLLSALTAFSQEEDSRPVYRVKSTLEFLQALGSDRIVEVEDSVTLYLSAALEDEYICGNLGIRQVDQGRVRQRSGIFSEAVADGRQLVLSRLYNLCIRGNASLLAIPRHALVLKFSGCAGISLEGLCLGHSEDGPAESGVIGIEGGGNFTLDGCTLSGCGSYGIQGQFFNRLNIKNTNIVGCTEGPLLLQEAGEVLLENSDIISKP